MLPENVSRNLSIGSAGFICRALILVWIVELGFLLICQFAGGPLGLSVHPTGEDRVWVDLLGRHGLQTARDWWAMVSRNPLAPWWYIAFSPLFDSASGGIYLARKFLDLFQAIVAVLFINELHRGKQPTFALSCGILVLLWNFSGYIEQALFVMLISIGFSVLSLYFYVKYLNAARTQAEYLSLSLVAFLVALASYSIQCGVPLAIALLGLAYGRRGVPDGSSSWLWRTTIDVALFGVVFIVFMLIWTTTSGPTSSYFTLDVSLIARQLGASIANLAWHSDVTALVASTFGHWSFPLILFIFVSATLLFYILTRSGWGRRVKDVDVLNENERPWWKNPFLLGIASIAALVIPTIALEAMSTTWYPGSRSRMVQQIFQPLVYLGLCFLLASLIFDSKRRVTIQACCVALLCAFATVTGVEYNRQLVELSAYEDNLIAGLKKIVPRLDRVTHFFVRIDNEDWYGGRNDELNRILIQRSYGSKGVFLDAIFAGAPADPKHTVTFDSDDQGVFSPSTQAYVSYKQSVFTKYDGKSVSLLNPIDAATLKGYQASFNRSETLWPQLGSTVGSAGCPARFDFDVSPNGEGWSVPEQTPEGSSFVWMAAKTATIQIENSCRGNLKIAFRVLQPIAQDVLSSLRLQLNSRTFSFRQTRSAGEIAEYEVNVPANSVPDTQHMILRFDVDHVVIPTGGTRTLAVPFDWLVVKGDGNQD